MLEVLKKYNYWDKKPIKVGFLRQNYIQKVQKYINNNLIKVFIGQRRVGKSYILRQIVNYLIK